MEEEAQRLEILEAFQLKIQEVPTEWLEETIQKMEAWNGPSGDLERTAAMTFLSGSEFMEVVHEMAQIHPALREVYLIGVDELAKQHYKWYLAELERRKNAPAAAPTDDR